MGGFFILESIVHPEKKTSRTAVYVDGYNLYYGRLRGTCYKWLDIVRLFENVLVERDQNEALVSLKFFTAHALANFAQHGASSVSAQHDYHRALSALYGDRYRPIYGKHTVDRTGAMLPAFVSGEPFDRHRRVRVWRQEEKQTDVNLALHMFIDAWQDRYDRLVLVSNDSDAEPALKAIREHFPHINIGIIAPIHPVDPARTIGRRPSRSLASAADWSIAHLSDSQLQNAQLPALIPTRKKPIRKPSHW